MKDDPSRIQLAAERFADVFGSVRFLVGQNVVIAGWILWQLYGPHHDHFDPFPFILLNLALSLQAAESVCIIMIGNKRSDRFREQRAAENHAHIEDVHKWTKAMHEDHFEQLTLQSQTLEKVKELVEGLHEKVTPDAQN